MHREPNVGFNPGSPGSRPGPKAGAKPLHHPGIPKEKFLKCLPDNKFKNTLCRNEDKADECFRYRQLEPIALCMCFLCPRSTSEPPTQPPHPTLPLWTSCGYSLS
uniref:Uncharacterized protein n=2 Tax=Canis lupus familiaris TaxID=9615 RepID=A0A8C0MEE8_CANLF